MPGSGESYLAEAAAPANPALSPGLPSTRLRQDSVTGVPTIRKPHKVRQRLKRIHSIGIRHLLQCMPLDEPLDRHLELLARAGVGDRGHGDDVIGHMPR